MANVVVGGAYATDIVATQKVFYGQQPSFSYQIMLMLSTQIIGFSLGGLLRRFLVWPSSMIWPGALVNCALFNTLHKSYGQIDRSHLSREKFFCIVLGCSFVWYWLPGYLFTALSVFNWVCWIVPNNTVANQLFGTQSGLGMGIFTFDWAMISYVGSPLVTPVSFPNRLQLQCLDFFRTHSGGPRRTQRCHSSSVSGSSRPLFIVRELR
jgi:hypothetical protein